MNIAKFGIEIDVAQARASIHTLVIELHQLPIAANNAAGGMSKLAKACALILAPLAAAWAALKAFTGGLGFLEDAIAKASEMEKFRNSWAFFLGSFDAARAKMKELNQYAKDSPFDIPGVNKAALTLAKLKSTGLETMEGLKMVGNAAAVAGQDIDAVALKLSKLINNLSRGGSPGDEASDLGEMQVFSANLIAKLQDLGGDASNFPKLLKLIKDELEKTAGATQIMETSWEGMTAQLTASWDEMKTALGEPFIVALNPLLGDLSKTIDEVTNVIRGWAPVIQAAVSNIPTAFRALKSEGGFQLALTAGWDALVILMNQTWKATEKTLISIYIRAGWELLNLINKMNKREFWDGLVTSLSGALSRAIDIWWNDKIQPMLEKLDSVGRGAGQAASAASNAASNALDSFLKSAEERRGGKPPTLQQAPMTGSVKQATFLMDLFVKGSRLANGLPMNPPDRPPDAINPTIDPEPDLPTEPANVETLLFPDIGPAPAIEPFVLEAQKPTQAMTLWAKLWDMTRKSVLDQITETAKKNEALVQQKRKERDAAAAKVAAADAKAPESEKDKKKRMAELIPGMDITLKQGEDYAKGLLEKSLTPEEAYQAELKKIAGISEALKLSKEDQAKMEQYVTDEYLEAQKKRDDATKRSTLSQMNALQKLMYEWSQLSKQVAEAGAAIMQAIADNITDAIVSMVEGTKSASEAFSDMAQGIVRSILQIITRLIVQYALMAAMGMATGVQVPNFTAFSQKALSAGVMHEGGTVGEASRSRMVSPAVFAGAPRYHTGGVVGLGPTEVPIIAERGEIVLTKQQALMIQRETQSRFTSEVVGGGHRSPAHGVSAEIFANAQRFHTGGVVGGGESPFEAEPAPAMTRGEAMSLKGRLSGEDDKGGDGKSKITIVNVANFQELGPYLMSDPSIIMNVLSTRRTEVRELLAG